MLRPWSVEASVHVSGGRRCYAEPLGGCDGGLSLEHYFTEAIFGKGGFVNIEGRPGFRDRQVPLSSAGARILCRAHNSQLSTVDDEAVRLSRYILELGNTTGTSEIRWVNGPLIERWLLKAACGIWAAGHINGVKVAISEQLLRFLFGIDPTPAPLGLHSLVPAAVFPRSQWEFNFTQVFASHPARGEVPVAAYISLHGLPFLLSLGGVAVDQCLPINNRDVQFANFDLRNATAKHRPASVTLHRDDSTAARVIYFDGWP